MDRENFLIGEKSSADAFLSEKAQQSQSTFSAPSEVLLEHNREPYLPSHLPPNTSCTADN